MNLIKRIFPALILFITSKLSMACDACEKQQPELLRGITHGAGPAGNSDFLIVGFISVITVLTLIFSLKYLLTPGETSGNHIKRTVLEP